MKCISRRIIKAAWALMIILCVAGTITLGANAQTAGSFSVRAVIPDNQIDRKQTYFDLRMTPGAQQTVEVVIDNSSDDVFVAKVQLNAASTGRNGLIVYTEPNVRDELLKVSVTDVATLDAENVTVPARGSKAVAINIKMPDEPVDGVILGGIAVTEEKPEAAAQTSQGVSLANQITYVIALKLTESDTEPAADFTLSSVTPDLVNFKTAVVATLQNRAARIVKGMELNAQVFRKGTDTVLRELSLTNVEMAPLSSGNFVIDWQNQPLDRGTYRLKMTARYDNRTWEWDEEFTIGTEAVDLNTGAVGLVSDYTWFYALSMAAAFIVLLFVAYHLGKRRKSDEGSRI